MQIDQQVKPILLTPRPAQLQIPESVLSGGSVFRLKEHIIHRHSHVVESQTGDVSDIRLYDEAVKMRLVISVELGDPSAQIHAFLKSLKLSHMCSPFCLTASRLLMSVSSSGCNSFFSFYLSVWRAIICLYTLQQSHHTSHIIVQREFRRVRKL